MLKSHITKLILPKPSLSLAQLSSHLCWNFNMSLLNTDKFGILLSRTNLVKTSMKIVIQKVDIYYSSRSSCTLSSTIWFCLLYLGRQ